MEETLTQLMKDYPTVAPLIFILARAIAIIIPPIPGAVVDIPGMVAFGWELAFIYAEIGIMLGAMTAFYLARIFREPLVRWIAPLRKVQEWEETLSEREQFWAWVGLRLPTNPVFDTVSYAAGLTKCSPGMFFATTLVGNLPTMFIFYFVGGQAFNFGLWYGISASIGIILLFSIVFRHVQGRRKRNRQS